MKPSKSCFLDTLNVSSSGAAFDGTCAGGGRSVDSDVVSGAWEAGADREVPSLRVDTPGPRAGVASSVDSSVPGDAWEGDAEVPWLKGIPIIGAHAGAAAGSVDGGVVNEGWEDDGGCEIP